MAAAELDSMEGVGHWNAFPEKMQTAVGRYIRSTSARSL